MASQGFLETVFDNGIKHANYFNGRLLSADDLKQDGDAAHLHHRLLGRAVGPGVVEGLWVTRAGSVLSVTEGLAVNREGVTLRLPSPVSFTVNPPPPDDASPDVIFTDCEGGSGPGGPTARSAHLLVLCPVSKFEGLAPTKMPIVGSDAPECGPRWRVEGVGFRLLRVPLPFDAEAEGARRRNRIAHHLFGSERLAGPARTDFPPPQSALETLADLRPAHVPLGVLYWTGSTIEFVDNWAARRRVTRPAATLARPEYVSDGTPAANEAHFLQFQDHFGELVSAGSLLTLELAQQFRYLPPAGIFHGRDQELRNLSLGTFLRGIAYRGPEFIDAAQLNALFRESFDHEPIDLSGGDMIRLYKTWQNDRALARGEPVQPFLVFTSGHLPTASAARFDVARWDGANYQE